MPKVIVTLIRDDTEAHPWHWEAREANGHLLATTPPGEWYADKRDALQAVRTLFGNTSEVIFDHAKPDHIHQPGDPTGDEYPIGEVQG